MNQAKAAPRARRRLRLLPYALALPIVLYEIALIVYPIAQGIYGSFQQIELAADEEGRKPGGSWRVVPLVKPLRALLRRAWIAQGRPTEGKVCPPRHASRSVRNAWMPQTHCAPVTRAEA